MEMSVSVREPWQYEADIVVVGGGGSGLAAAVSAAQNKQSVILLEKAPRIGGTTALAVGSIAAADTALQKSAGVQDSPALHFDDIGKIVQTRSGKENINLRRVLTTNGAETVRWLNGLGVEFYGPSPAPGTTVPRMHNAVPNARAYVTTLGNAAQHLGVKILTDMRARHLVRDERGRIIGVGAQTSDADDTIRVRARKAVILATGYFHADPELRKQYISAQADNVDSIEPNQTGDGHRMAMEAGAQLVNMGVDSAPEFRFVTTPGRALSARLPTHPAFAKAMRFGATWMPKPLFLQIVKSVLTSYTAPTRKLFQEGAILLNADGKRFVNELTDFEYVVAAQPNKVAYLLFDQRVAAKFSSYPNYVSTAPGIAYAYLPDYRRLRPDIYKSAPTLERLAAAVGLPVDAVRETVETYNRFVSQDEDAEFGRTLLGNGILTAPFHILGPAKSYFVDSQGGPAVNEQLQVLDTDGQPIPGLYAAGAVSKGALVYGGAGFDLSWVFTSARLAGRYASAEIASSA